MFSLAKHVKTQVGNMNDTVHSIGAGGLKVVGILPKKKTSLEAEIVDPSTFLKAVTEIPTRDPPEHRPSRILSLDGGGVRGYSALIILQAFMLRVKLAMGAEEDILPADFFDLIIGTSTGGIMAIMLGRLRMTVDECLEAYRQLSSRVFSGGIATTVLNGGIFGQGKGLGLGMGIIKGKEIDQYLAMAVSSALSGEPAMYDGVKLEKHIKRAIVSRPGEELNNEEGLLEDKRPNACPTAIVAALQTNAAAPYLMRSYIRKDKPTVDQVKIWEAARATSAAPAFFSPITIGKLGVSYIDGAVSGHCNPAVLAREEAEALWPEREIGLLLSLGTGSPTEVSLSGQVSQKLVGFIGLSANTVQVHESMIRSYNQTHEPGFSPYVRLSVEHSIDKVRMDDHEQMGHIASCTQTYIAKEATAQLLTRAVDLGLHRAPIIPKLNPRQSIYGSGSMTPGCYPGSMTPYGQITHFPIQQIQYTPLPQQQGYITQVQQVPYAEQQPSAQSVPQPPLMQSPPPMASEVE